MIKRFLFLIAVIASSTMAMAQLAAFPGAEGFGKYAAGARGVANRQIYHVTNLNNSGAGSLRDAVSQPGRIVVFDVSGVIVIPRGEPLTFAKNLYIAGQTAPGKGVEVYGERVSFSSADNLICRYMRFRMGRGGTDGKDAAGIANGRNMIFDHCSITWGRDETFSISWDNKGSEPGDITIQNCIMGQGLQTHSCGGLMQTDGGISLLRNLYIDNKTRNNKFKGLHQFVNNVVYNWGDGGCNILGDTERESWLHIEGNYYIYGPSSTIKVFSRATPQCQVYYNNCVIDDNCDGKLNGRVAVYEDFKRSSSESIYPTMVNSLTAFSPAAPKTMPSLSKILSPEDAYYHIVREVGASLPLRDEVDELLISQLTSLGTLGALISNESENGITNGVGIFPAASKAADSDNDGIPDTYELANGLDPNDASDALKLSPSGYLYIEEYANSLDGTVRVAGCQNFSLESAEENTITVKWTNPTEYTSHKIYISDNGGVTYKETVIAEGNATKYTFTGLQKGTPHRIYIINVKDDAESIESEIINVRTKYGAYIPLKCEEPTPANNKKADHADPFTISWANYTGSAAGSLTYKVYMGTEKETLSQVAATTATSMAIKLEANTTYFWRVDATNDLGTTTGDVWQFTTGPADAQLVHTAHASYGSAAPGNPNAIDAEMHYFNNDALSAWSAFGFAEFALNLPPNTTVTSATLQINYTQGGKSGRESTLNYLNPGTLLNYESDKNAANFSSSILNTEANHQYSANRTFIAKFNSTSGNNSEQKASFDVTSAVRACQEQNIAIFQITGNVGGAMLYGKASAKAPKLLLVFQDNAKLSDYTINYVCNDKVVKSVTVEDATIDEEVIITDAQKAPFFVGETKYTYVSDDAMEYDVKPNNATVVTVKVAEVPTVAYTVNAVCNGEIIKVLAEGTAPKDDKTVYYSQFIAADGNLYACNAKSTAPSFGVLIDKDGEFNIEYTKQSIPEGYKALAVYEAEDLDNTGADNSATASGGKTAHTNALKKASIGVLQPGDYVLRAQLVANETRCVHVRNTKPAGENLVTTCIQKGSKVGSNSCTFSVNEAEEFFISGWDNNDDKFNQGADIDFVVILGKLKETPTSVESLKSAIEDDTFYDLTGRKSNADKKGLYVGKKGLKLVK